MTRKVLNFNILKAEQADLPEILSLQKRAYESEARLVNDFTITPLTQTLEGITEDFYAGVILKAVLVDTVEIIGSVRGRLTGNTLHIGRLFVSPDYQNRGVGAALLSTVEALYPAARYELFTSEKSGKNLSLYTKNGYTEFKREPLNENCSFVYFEKNARP